MAPINFHTLAIEPAVTALKNAHAVIAKGQQHAIDNKIDPETYLSASIHPDMKDFRFQVYRFTDAIKFVPSRVNPALESITLTDDQKTFEELLERIQKTITYLESFKVSDFDGKENEEIVIKFPGKQIKMQALEYVYKWAHPNMWFHIVTAYDILRMKGVDVGKYDFLNGSKTINIETVEQ